MIVFRQIKGLPLTHAELDNNFEELSIASKEATQAATDAGVAAENARTLATTAQGQALAAVEQAEDALAAATAASVSADAVDTRVDGLVTSLSGEAVLRQQVADEVSASFYRLFPDSNGIYTTLEFKRRDGTLIKRSVLSGGTSPEYTTRTETLFGANGTTVVETRVYALTYSGGQITSEAWV